MSLLRMLLPGSEYSLAKDKELRAWRLKYQITNSKSQINSKFQFQMTKKILLRIWVIGICLGFGAWNLVLP
jgi:hypothetical protein